MGKFIWYTLIGTQLKYIKNKMEKLDKLISESQEKEDKQVTEVFSWNSILYSTKVLCNYSRKGNFFTSQNDVLEKFQI